MYRMISQQPVNDSLLADAAEFFSNSESPIAPTLFHNWYHQLQENLHQQPALKDLAASWREQLRGRDQFDNATAEDFLRKFSGAIRLDQLDIQAIVCGYSQRSANGPFDTELSQSNQPQSWTVLYTTQGCARLRTGIREVLLGPGDALLLSPEACYAVSREKGSDNWCHYWLSFQPVPQWRRYLHWSSVGPDTYLMAVPAASREIVRSSMEQVLQVTSDSSPLKKELETNLVEYLLLRFAELLSTEHAPVLDERVLGAQRYIEQHYNDDFTLRQVADAAHISSSRLTNLFKAQTGLSIFKWRDEKRLIEAAQLLRASDLSIAQVGHRVGFQDAAYFTRVFSRHFGRSPRAYRSDRCDSFPLHP